MVLVPLVGSGLLEDVLSSPVFGVSFLVLYAQIYAGVLGVLRPYCFCHLTILRCACFMRLRYMGIMGYGTRSWRVSPGVPLYSFLFLRVNSFFFSHVVLGFEIGWNNELIHLRLTFTWIPSSRSTAYHPKIFPVNEQFQQSPHSASLGLGPT